MDEYKDNDCGDNPFQEEGSPVNWTPFLAIIETGASAEEAAEITGISRDTLAFCRKAIPNFDESNRLMAEEYTRNLNNNL